MAVEGTHERDVFGVQAMLWIHSLCEFVSEAFRADEFLDLFTLAILSPHECVFYFTSTLFAPLGSSIPDLPVHVSLGPSAIDALSTFFSYLSDRFRRWLQGSSFEWLWFFLFLWWRFWKG